MNPVAYDIGKFLFRLMFRLGWGQRTDGGEHVPGTGPVILCANHASFFDPPMVGTTCPRRCSFMARDSLRRVPILGYLMALVGTRFVARDAPSATVLAGLVEILREGQTVVVFPEGTRSADGRVQAFKRGVLLLAKKSGATVVPVGIRGSFRAFPRGRRLPRPFVRCTVSYGEPMSAAEIRAEGGLEELRRRVGRLCGQPLVGDAVAPGAPAAVSGDGATGPSRRASGA